MLKALAVKELRETAWMGGVALAVYAWIVWRLMQSEAEPGLAARGLTATEALWGTARGQIPFVSGQFLTWLVIVSVCLCIALAMRQTVGESRGGTFPLLLFRPASRERIIAAKLAAGVWLLLLCSAVPLLVYAAWAATPGTHASPFEWSMTVPAWKMWFSAPLLYLGAFLCGIRPARWIGTRLLPFVAVAFLVFLGQILPLTWPWLLLAALLVGALLVANILFVARTRDFS